MPSSGEIVAAHPVYEDPDLSVPITLRHYDGTVSETRGVVSTLDESASTLTAEFTGAGAQAWVSGRYEPDEIEFVTANGRTHRALGGAALAGGGFQSTRLALAPD